MRKNIKKIITVIACTALFVGVPAFAQLGLDETASRSGLKGQSKGNIVEIIGDVVSTALSLVSIVFFVLILYAGFRWMVARGNEQEIEKAQGIITSSIIGILIIFAAYAITAFVFRATSGEQKVSVDEGTCSVYKALDSGFGCYDAGTQCDPTAGDKVKAAYGVKNVGTYTPGDKYIGSACPSDKNNIVCCIAKPSE